MSVSSKTQKKSKERWAENVFDKQMSENFPNIVKIKTWRFMKSEFNGIIITGQSPNMWNQTACFQIIHRSIKKSEGKWKYTLNYMEMENKSGTCETQ